MKPVNELAELLFVWLRGGKTGTVSGNTGAEN